MAIPSMLAILWDHDYISLATSIVMFGVAVAVMLFFIWLWWRGKGFEPELEDDKEDDHV